MVDVHKQLLILADVHKQLLAVVDVLAQLLILADVHKLLLTLWFQSVKPGNPRLPQSPEVTALSRDWQSSSVSLSPGAGWPSASVSSLTVCLSLKSTVTLSHY